MQLISGQYTDTYESSIYIECEHLFQVQVNGRFCLLRIQEMEIFEFSSMPDQYRRVFDCLALVYSITDKKSFEMITDLRQEALKIKDVTHETNEAWPMILIGSKSDLEDERQVTNEQGEELARSLGMPFIEISAKKNENIDVAFHGLLRLYYQFRKERKDDEPQNKPKNKCVLQ